MSVFSRGLRVNRNANANLDPRTFIAHLPVGRRYSADFLDDSGVKVTSVVARYELSLCPDGVFVVGFNGKLPLPPLSFNLLPQIGKYLTGRENHFMLLERRIQPSE